MLIGNSTYAHVDLVVGGQEQAIDRSDVAWVANVTEEDGTDFILISVVSPATPQFNSALLPIQPDLGLVKGVVTHVRIRAPPYFSC